MFTEGKGGGKNRPSTGVEAPRPAGRSVSYEENVIVKYHVAVHDTQVKCHQQELLPQVCEQVRTSTRR